ncbi:MAG: sugar ABC transporter ATP-binding protein [Solirubrobacteraceae bacterium]|nr:sugar ABC transporter ATP-binding protein [Patulibacter sp.]
MSAAAQTSSLAARGIVKRYGDATVLRGVDLDMAGGRVDGLVGRNGAGKSTLVGVLTGRVQSDGGTVLADGAELDIRKPADALAAGIVAVPQELVMPMDMSVAEVVTFGAEPKRRGLLSLRSERRQVQELMDGLGLDLDITAPVGSLPVSWQKVVLLAQALHRQARYLILDEPTAAMNAEDCERVLAVVRRLRERGLAILYISHRFDEVAALCDRVTAMADGQVTEIMEGAEVTQERLVASITGSDEPATDVRRRRTQTARGYKGRSDASAPNLRAHGIVSGRVRGLDLEVRPGQVIGIAGLPGSGVEDVFSMLSGHLRPTAGEVTVGDGTLGSVGAAQRLGVGFLPASRASASLPSEPVVENLVLPALRQCSTTGGLITTARGHQQAATVVERLSLGPVVHRRMGQLSGGNQQRVLVGAKLLASPKFLLLEDPTVGVDVAARAELHELLWSLAGEGIGFLVGSTDPEELLELCDHIHVLRRGELVASWPAAEASEYALVAAMTGDTTLKAA